MATQGFTNFPKGFAGGLNVRGMPLLQTQPAPCSGYSNASTTPRDGQKDGSDGNRGTYDAPFATIAGALDDVHGRTRRHHFRQAGHAETISSASILALNVAGVAIVGLGSGSSRPTLTFTTTTAANIPITAADMSIQNFLFKANFAAVVSVFTATSRTRRRTSRSSAASSATRPRSRTSSRSSPAT
jgi:hypothetical protein